MAELLRTHSPRSKSGATPSSETVLLKRVIGRLDLLNPCDFYLWNYLKENAHD